MLFFPVVAAVRGRRWAGLRNVGVITPPVEWWFGIFFKWGELSWPVWPIWDDDDAEEEGVRARALWANRLDKDPPVPPVAPVAAEEEEVEEGARERELCDSYELPRDKRADFGVDVFGGKYGFWFWISFSSWKVVSAFWANPDMGVDRDTEGEGAVEDTCLELSASLITFGPLGLALWALW